MTTVWVYVDTSKQVGDLDHLKVFVDEATAETHGSQKTIRKAWRSSMKCWNDKRTVPRAISARPLACQYHCEESKPAKSKKLHRSVLRQFNTKIWLHYWVKVTYPADTAVSQLREASPSHVRKSVVTRPLFIGGKLKPTGDPSEIASARRQPADARPGPVGPDIADARPPPDYWLLASRDDGYAAPETDALTHCYY
jgi:hypothetical protein